MKFYQNPINFDTSKKSSYNYIKMKFRFPVTLLALISVFFSMNACPALNEKEPDSFPFHNSPRETSLSFKGELYLNRWMDILQEIENNGVNVTLDLSACTVPASGGDVLKRAHEDGSDFDQANQINQWNDYIQFDPIAGYSTGKSFVTSIILPDKATMICHAKTDNNALTQYFELDNDLKKEAAFRYFTNLRSVTGKYIRLIGNLAFLGCTSLETVNFPRANHIMQYAFYGCSALKTMNGGSVRDIQPSAFENCSSLLSAEFPFLDHISQAAFKNCKSLKNLEFPLVTKIDKSGFQNCSGLTKISFPAATKIGDDAFRNCTGLQIARFWANPEASFDDHPLKPWRDVNSSYTAGSSTPPTPVDPPFMNKSMAFYPNAFRGCRSLQVLDISYAWNVYFAGGALADIGEHLELHLFDDYGINDSGKCWGHPQLDQYFGDKPPSEKYGGLSLKSVTVRAPTGTQIEKDGKTTDVTMLGIVRDMRGRYSYDSGEKDGEKIIYSYHINVEVVRHAPLP